MNKVEGKLIVLVACLVFSLPSFSQQSRGDTLPQNVQSDSDALVVPKGTQIQTDISRTSPGTPATPYEYDGKVEIPVRLGFSTAIPVGSKVAVRITDRHVDEGLQFAAELVAVTVQGKSYKVQTDQMPVDPSTAKEVTFTLLKPLKISR